MRLLFVGDVVGKPGRRVVQGQLTSLIDRHHVDYTVVNVGRLSDFRSGSTIGPDELREAGLAHKRGRIKILGEGELSKKLTVRAHKFSRKAQEVIEAVGGSCEVIAP